MANRETILALAAAARNAAALVSSLSTGVKDAVLDQMAHELHTRREWLKEENKKDVQQSEQQGMSVSMRDRLSLSDGAINAMREALKQVSSLRSTIPAPTTAASTT